MRIKEVDGERPKKTDMESKKDIGDENTVVRNEIENAS